MEKEHDSAGWCYLCSVQIVGAVGSGFESVACEMAAVVCPETELDKEKLKRNRTR